MGKINTGMGHLSWGCSLGPPPAQSARPITTECDVIIVLTVAALYPQRKAGIPFWAPNP